MTRLRLLLLLGILLAAAPGAAAQRIVRGTVTDAATGEALPAANIQVEGTYRGTITNADGRYELRLDTLPATLVARYIGYETARRTVTAASGERQDLRLQPVTYQLDEIVVTGEDPAIRIMREVIERKKLWRNALRTYETEAYNRFTLANDTGIVSIIETFTETFWDRARGMKETLKARRETSNLDIEEALPAALFVTNLYDDDVEVGGYTLIGVTHPKALSHYDFRLLGTRRLDDQVVYDIAVEPKSRLKSAFVGRVAVLDSAYALLEVELRPGEAFLFPPPIERYDVTYRQQFSSFGKDFWLPVDFRADLALRLNLGGLLAFPTIHIDQVSRFTNYQVNVPLPDSLYREERYLTVDSAAVKAGTRLAEAGGAVPLSQPEEAAYAGIDSTMGLERAFAPTGPLARFVKMDARAGDGDERRASARTDRRRWPSIDLDPDLWYNRVDALHAGLRLEVDVADVLTLRAGGGYSTGLEGADRWSYEGSARLEGGTRTTFFAQTGFAAGTDLRYRSDLYGRFFNGLDVLLGGDDYFDYFRNERFFADVGVAFSQPEVRFSLGLQAERHASLQQKTSYDLVGRSARLRPNPPIDEGRHATFTAKLVVGDDFDVAGVFGRRRLALGFERNPGDYTRYTLDLVWRLETFYRRRLLPNTLDVRVAAGTATGTLLPQRFGIVDGALGVYTPFGALKTLGGVPYEGEEHLAFFWEHNFRTVPFELLGLRGLARRGYSLIVFGGHGRTWLRPEASDVPTLGYVPRVPDGFHHELGVSLSGLFGFFRLDAAARLDAPGFAVGVAAARIF